MRIAFAVLLLLAVLSPRNALAQALNPSVQSAIVAAVEKERKIYGGVTPVPAVLIGVWDHDKSYVHGFGYADLAKRRPLSPTDHFRVGSNTKTFVISVLLQLVDEGKLRLDDPLSRFNLGVTIPNARNITVREICQMRSGIFEAYDTPQVNRMDMKPTMTFKAKQLVGHDPFPGVANAIFRDIARILTPSNVPFVK